VSKTIINPRIDRAWFIANMRLRAMRQPDLAKLLDIDRSALHRALTGRRFFTAPELGKMTFLFEEPLSEVAQRAGVEFWSPPQNTPPKPKRIQQQQALEAVQAIARALGLTA